MLTCRRSAAAGARCHSSSAAPLGYTALTASAVAAAAVPLPSSFSSVLLTYCHAALLLILLAGASGSPPVCHSPRRHVRPRRQRCSRRSGPRSLLRRIPPG